MIAADIDARAAGLLLAQGFGDYVRRTALASGTVATLARRVGEIASEVSLALQQGHVCVDLGALMADADGTEEEFAMRLLCTGVVGKPQARGTCPLILDTQGRVYLHRYFDYEARLAQSWVVRRRASAPALPDASTIALLRDLFRSSQTGRAAIDWQQLACAQALLSRITVISGGPGTGKTTTLVNLLACLLQQDAHCRIALVAPTGKAAARMSEAIRQRATHLPPELAARLPAEAGTVHRLLGATARAGEFFHHAGNPLPLDVLVVDEASMLDLALSVRLLEAVPAQARVILLGDKDQLAAVEAGAVFAELGADPHLSDSRRHQLAQICEIDADRIDIPVTPDWGLADSTVWLTRSYRFGADSAIGRLARAINQGDAARAAEGFDSVGELSWIADHFKGVAPESLAAMRLGYASFVSAVRDPAASAPDVLRAFERFRVLCAVREGARGVVSLNHVLAQSLRAAAAHPADPGDASDWYPGRPVMVLRNDAAMKLFNGDIGIAWPDANGDLRVHFPDGKGGVRPVSPLRLPEHETAFAMTVHKSQGSEFDSVLLVLPAEVVPVLTRELIYTAVTRAREQVTVCGDAAVFAAGVRHATRRHSGLLQRIREAQQA
jgi:exodeoxyribonuclease V alpha subunit